MILLKVKALKKLKSYSRSFRNLLKMILLEIKRPVKTKLSSINLKNFLKRFFLKITRFKSSSKRFENFLGMTLLEIIVALALFSFLFVFIVQVLKQNHRQAKKIKQDIQWSSSLFHVLSLIRSDFQGVSYLLDFNDTLNLHFPMNPDLDWEKIEEDLLADRAYQQGRSFNKNLYSSKNFRVYFSPHFVFEGKNNEIEFYSYSFSSSGRESFSPQWIKIRYSIESCPNVSGYCLIRYSSRYWNPLEKKEEPEESRTLLRAFNSLKFFYSNSSDFLSGDWKDSWKLNAFYAYPNRPGYPRELPFPSVVKIEMEKEKYKQTLFFPVSQFFLSSWNPYGKNFLGIPKWTPQSENKGQNSNRSALPQNFSPGEIR